MHASGTSGEAGSSALARRLSINEFMLPGSAFEEDLEICRKTGVSGIGLWESKLESGRDPQLVSRFAESGLQATVCTPEVPSILPSDFFPGPSDPSERVEAVIASIKRFEPFSPALFLVVTGIDASLSRGAQWRALVEGYKRVGAAAAEIGATVGVEPLRMPEHSVVCTVAEAAALVAEVDTEGVGILYDVWHLWDSPTLIEDIESYAALFTAVHLGDWPDRPDPGINRAIPGEGVIPLDRILAALEGAGYSGWYDLELLADPEAEDSLLKLDREEMLRRTKQGVEAAWEKAGLSPEGES